MKWFATVISAGWIIGSIHEASPVREISVCTGFICIAIAYLMHISEKIDRLR